MDNIQDHLRDISEIRSMMEQNSKFLSLSGLAGVSAGVIALGGAVAAWLHMGQAVNYIPVVMRGNLRETLIFFAIDALLVLVLAIGAAAFFSIRMAKKRDFPIWNSTAKNTLLALMIPLVAGGLFCLIQLSYYSVIWIPSTMLLFYGMALLNASKFTMPEIRYLAVTEIVLGLLCAIWVGNGLIFWALGFGVMHIVYGAVMYYKYER